MASRRAITKVQAVRYSSAATTFASYFGDLGVGGFTTRDANAAFCALRASPIESGHRAHRI